jgi:hypothetical protein
MSISLSPLWRTITINRNYFINQGSLQKYLMGRVPWVGRSVASYQILVEAEADGCCDGGLDEGDREPLVEPLEEPLVPAQGQIEEMV